MASPEALSLSAPCELSKQVARLRGAFFDSACASVCGYRPQNEDCHVMMSFAAPAADHHLPTAASNKSNGSSKSAAAPFSGSLTVFAVFDGHGGSTCAEYMAKELPGAVVAAIHTAHRRARTAAAGGTSNSGGGASIAELKEAIQDSFAKVDRAYLDGLLANMKSDRERLQAYGNLADTSGTTAVLGIVEELPSSHVASADQQQQQHPVARCLVCNLGDSRLQLVRNGQLAYTTVDQKATDPAELARIQASPVQYHLEDRRVGGVVEVARALGDLPFKPDREHPARNPLINVPVVDVVDLLDRDVVLLGCDGVFGGASFPQQQLLECVYNRLQAQPATAPACHYPFMSVVASELAHRAVNGGSTDNVSCMLVRVFRRDSPGAAASKAEQDLLDAASVSAEQHPTHQHSSSCSVNSSHTLAHPLRALSATFGSLTAAATNTAASSSSAGGMTSTVAALLLTTGPAARSLVPQYGSTVASASTTPTGAPQSSSAAAPSAPAPATAPAAPASSSKRRGSQVKNKASAAAAAAAAVSVSASETFSASLHGHHNHNHAHHHHSSKHHHPPPLGFHDHFFIPCAIPDTERAWLIFQQQCRAAGQDPKRAIVRRIHFLRHINNLNAVAMQAAAAAAATSSSTTRRDSSSTERSLSSFANQTTGLYDSLSGDQAAEVLRGMAAAAAPPPTTSSSGSFNNTHNGGGGGAGGGPPLSDTARTISARSAVQNLSATQLPTATTSSPTPSGGASSNDVVANFQLGADAEFSEEEAALMAVEQSTHGVACEYTRLLHMLQQVCDRKAAEAKANAEAAEGGSGPCTTSSSSGGADAMEHATAAMSPSSLSDEGWYEIFDEFIRNSLRYHRAPRTLPHQQHQQNLDNSGSHGHVAPFAGLDASTNRMPAGAAVFGSGPHGATGSNIAIAANTISGGSVSSLPGLNLTGGIGAFSPGATFTGDPGSYAAMMSQAAIAGGDSDCSCDDSDDDAAGARRFANAQQSDRLMDDNMASGPGVLPRIDDDDDDDVSDGSGDEEVDLSSTRSAMRRK